LIPERPRFSPKDAEIPNLGTNSPEVGTLEMRSAHPICAWDAKLAWRKRQVDTRQRVRKRQFRKAKGNW